MLNMPILKFEKSCNYLIEQLDIQKNNKQLILDIISNIGLLLNVKNRNQYESILDEANVFLKIVSSNITAIEQLHVEIQNITKELNSVLDNQSKGLKTKEFYIAAFSNIKHTVIMYSQKFQELEEYLSITNNDFNDFINRNNFKYNFVVLDENSNSYTFTGFTINETSEEPSEVINDVINIDEDEILNLNNITIEDLEESIIEDFSENLEEEIISDENEDSVIENSSENLEEEIISDENEDSVIENSSENLEEEIISDENEDSVIENSSENLEEEIISDENEDSVIEDSSEDLEEDIISDENEDSVIEDSSEDLEEDIISDENEDVVIEGSPENSGNKNLSKIDKLTSEFRELLLHLSEANITNNDASISISSLFKSILPEDNFNNNEEFYSNEENTIKQEADSTEIDTPNTIERLEEFDDNISDEDLLEEALLDESLLENVIAENNLFDDLLEISENNTEVETDVENINIIENNEENQNLQLDDSILFNQFILQKLENDFRQESLELFNKENNINENIENNVDEKNDEIVENINITEIINETIENTTDDQLDDITEENNIVSNNDITSEDLTEIQPDLTSSTEIVFNENVLEEPNTFIDNEEDLIIEDDGVDEEIVNNIVENVLNMFTEEKSTTNISEQLLSSPSNNLYYSNMTSLEENIFDEYSSFEPARPVINYFKEPEKFINLQNPFAPSSNISVNETIDDKTNIDKPETLINDIEQSTNTNVIEENNLFNNNEPDINFEDINNDFSENSILEDINDDFSENSILEDINDDFSIEDILSIDSTLLTEYEDVSNEIINASLETNTSDAFENNITTESISSTNKTSKNKNLSKNDFSKRLEKIKNAVEDNRTLLISEKLQKIYLPYKLSELTNYVESYPGTYKSLKDVVEQEFILPFDYFKKNPSKSRFTETYNLLKNREGSNFIKSVSYAFRLLKKSNLNPAIIASCKTQHELDCYIYYLDSNNLNNFRFFDIIYEVNPM